ncbi:hypothetical protein D9756_010313 [Leucocoprinus leucothites]|uniref:CCL2-like lectin domain-containing protein n=1 Tax=Leucocoprinus leucothites TaxID=201217 RepID=A0A8H5CTV9_9AGAR|nr:hypothetical protein D9756_010313 [Leucoagaricus leucothites]
MSDKMPAPGVYYIVNRVLSPTGEKLAMTFEGKGELAKAMPLTNSAAQRWIIGKFDAKTQSVSPADSPSLQAGWGKGVIILPAGNYVWTIRKEDDGYTIQDGGVTVYWGLDHAKEGESISIGAGTGGEKQRWVLESHA